MGHLPPDSKVVGKRRPPQGSLEFGDGLQRLANEMGQGLVTPRQARGRLWPKGVFRFKSHEEADAWWIDQMQVVKKATGDRKEEATEDRGVQCDRRPSRLETEKSSAVYGLPSSVDVEGKGDGTEKTEATRD